MQNLLAHMQHLCIPCNQ